MRTVFSCLKCNYKCIPWLTILKLLLHSSMYLFVLLPYPPLELHTWRGTVVTLGAQILSLPHFSLSFSFPLPFHLIYMHICIYTHLPFHLIYMHISIYTHTYFFNLRKLVTYIKALYSYILNIYSTLQDE